MKVTPLDLRQQKFRRRFQGFDRAEVTALLHEVADQYESALIEVDRVRQEAVQMEARLNEHREHERNLKNTLMTAQRLSEDIKTTAELQARTIVREAESRSELLLHRTQARLEDLQREIDGLRLRRRDVETSIEATIGSLRNAIDFVREQDQQDRDDKILLHRPRQADVSPAPASAPSVQIPRTLEQLLEIGAQS
jgi:cell division initiation protein